jgi:hypothetical protein
VRPHPVPGALGRAETWLTWRKDCRSANLRAFVDVVQEFVGQQSGGGQEDPAAARLQPA